MRTDDQIRYEKLQYDISRDAATTSALPSVKTHKYEYFTDEEIFPSDQGRVIEQARVTSSPLDEAFVKQIKKLKIKE